MRFARRTRSTVRPGRNPGARATTTTLRGRAKARRTRARPVVRSGPCGGRRRTAACVGGVTRRRSRAARPARGPRGRTVTRSRGERQPRRGRGRQRVAGRRGGDGDALGGRALGQAQHGRAGPRQHAGARHGDAVALGGTGASAGRARRPAPPAKRGRGRSRRRPRRLEAAVLEGPALGRAGHDPRVRAREELELARVEVVAGRRLRRVVDERLGRRPGRSWSGRRTRSSASPASRPCARRRASAIGSRTCGSRGGAELREQQRVARRLRVGVGVVEDELVEGVAARLRRPRPSGSSRGRRSRLRSSSRSTCGRDAVVEQHVRLVEDERVAGRRRGSPSSRAGGSAPASRRRPGSRPG